MLERVQRQPSPVFGRCITQLIRDQTMAQLMEGDAQQRRDQAEQDAEYITEIKTVPNGLKCVDDLHPQLKVF